MPYKVRIENFEGPFDLLLNLVSRQKVDIGSISISEIADQYLEEVSHMENLDLDVASDFLLVASTLLEIKAQSLIPRQRDDLDDEIAELSPSEARDVLIERLMDYRQFKNAAASLYARYQAQGRTHERASGPDSEFLDVMPDFLAGVSLDSLGYLAARALARRETFLLESEHIASRPIPVEVHVQAIRQRIIKHKHLNFSDLVNASTPPEIVVVTFLALLELYKRQTVRLEQPKMFGDIKISYIEGSDELYPVDESAGAQENSASAENRQKRSSRNV